LVFYEVKRQKRKGDNEPKPDKTNPRFKTETRDDEPKPDISENATEGPTSSSPSSPSYSNEIEGDEKTQSTKSMSF
jgi:hypothetical protein